MWWIGRVNIPCLYGTRTLFEPRTWMDAHMYIHWLVPCEWDGGWLGERGTWTLSLTDPFLNPEDWTCLLLLTLISIFFSSSLVSVSILDVLFLFAHVYHNMIHILVDGLFIWIHWMICISMFIVSVPRWIPPWCMTWSWMVILGPSHHVDTDCSLFWLFMTGYWSHSSPLRLIVTIWTMQVREDSGHVYLQTGVPVDHYCTTDCYTVTIASHPYSHMNTRTSTFLMHCSDALFRCTGPLECYHVVMLVWILFVFHVLTGDTDSWCIG